MEKMFKDILIALFAVLLVIGMAGCGDAGGGDGLPLNATPATPATPQSFNDMTAAQLVGCIKIGWNLGNSLDAEGGETAWGNPKTTKANITAIKNAGFNIIRIPVSWTNGIDSNYNIKSVWMARVVEVVNYAIDNDMYVILNTHHDESIFKFMNSNAAAGKTAYKKIWEQIADTFKNYDEKLIFEGLNEPRTKGSAAEWSGGTTEEHTNLNAYYQLFVNAVRNSGGNNGKRILMINPYAASNSTTAMNALVLPTDTVPNKLIVSFHHYSPWDFAGPESTRNTWSADNGADTSAITSAIDSYYSKFVSHGIPVIIGEFGAVVKNSNATTVATWAKYFVEKAWAKGIKCVWWDDGSYSNSSGGFIIFKRSDNTFAFPSIKDALMSGTGIPDEPPPPPVVEGSDIVIGNWTWNAYNDGDNGGTSSITIAESPAGTLAINGNVVKVEGNYNVGFATWVASPDTPTLTALKTATSIKFTVKGDGKTYRISLPTTDIADYCYFETTFTTIGSEQEKTINISSFAQPTWGVQKGSLNKTLLDRIQFQSGEGASGTFNLNIKNLTVQ